MDVSWCFGQRRHPLLRPRRCCYDRNTTYDSRGDYSAIIGTRFDPTERRDDGGNGFDEVDGTVDFQEDVVAMLSSISPVLTSAFFRAEEDKVLVGCLYFILH